MISANDRGFLYGDGVFETVRCRQGNLLLWSLHRERLLKSCLTLRIPLDVGVFDSTVSAALAQAPSPDCIIKIIVTRGEGGRGYAPPKSGTATIVVQWHSLPPAMEDASQQGIDCIYCDHPLSLNPVTAGIKHLNRLDQVMASLQLAEAAESFPAIREGLMSDGCGHVLEGTRSNFFAVIDGRLCTPDLSAAGVQGVMRSFLIEQIKASGIALDIRHISKPELSLASELFVCNSVFGVWPVSRIVSLQNDSAELVSEFSAGQMTDLAQRKVQEIFTL